MKIQERFAIDINIKTCYTYIYMPPEYKQSLKKQKRFEIKLNDRFTLNYECSHRLQLCHTVNESLSEN